MTASLRLGGWMPISGGLRHIPVNAKALDYQCALFSLAGEAGIPASVTDVDALEFSKMTRGVECFIQLPTYLNPAIPEISSKETQRAYFVRFYRTAALLGARAVILDPPQKWANGSDVSMDTVESRVLEFFSLDLGDSAVQILFRTAADGLGHPKVLERLVRNLSGREAGSGKFGMALDLCRLSGTEDLPDDHEVEAYLARWERLTKAVIFSAFSSDGIGIIRRVWKNHPILLELRSIADQAEAAEHIRAVTEEVDILGL